MHFISASTETCAICAILCSLLMITLTDTALCSCRWKNRFPSIISALRSSHSTTSAPLGFDQHGFGQHFPYNEPIWILFDYLVRSYTALNVNYKSTKVHSHIQSVFMYSMLVARCCCTDVVKGSGGFGDCAHSKRGSLGVLIGRLGQKEQSQITAITRLHPLTPLMTLLHMQPPH